MAGTVTSCKAPRRGWTEVVDQIVGSPAVATAIKANPEGDYDGDGTVNFAEIALAACRTWL
jgi:hypothetical protein